MKQFNNCMHCLVFHQDWTRYDALIRTWIKIKQENGLFLQCYEPCQCVHCLPKQKIPPQPYSGIKEYFKKRGMKT